MSEPATMLSLPVEMPADLHAETRELVQKFAAALAQKLRDAEIKYGFDTGWRRDDWGIECQRRLLAHIFKGDPRDVAAYCAFCWYHHWRTS